MPAAVAVTGGYPHPPRGADPPEQATPLGAGTPQNRHPPWDRHPLGAGLETPVGVGLETPPGQIPPQLPPWVWA